MKKITALVFFTCMCIGTAVNAANVTVKDSLQSVEITERVESDKSAVLVIVKSGDELDVDRLISVRTENPEKNGNVTWSVGLSEKVDGALSDGEYDGYIKQNDEVFKKISFTYASVESRNKVSEELSKVISDNDFKAILDNSDYVYALKVFGFNMDDYDECDKSDVAKKAAKDIGDFKTSTPREIADTFNTFMIIDLIGKTDKTEELLEIINLKFEDKSFSDIEDEKLINWICEIMKDGKCETSEAFSEMYEKANILYIINNSRANYLQSNLEKYADKLGIKDDSDYKKYLKITSKGNVNKAIVKAFEKSPAKNVGDLTDIIGEAVDSYGKSSSSSTAGGGGGGGSSKGSGVALSVPSDGVVNKSEVQESDKPVFGDMSSAAWAAEAVKAMSEAGIISGDENGNFRPDDTVRREEFIKMLVLAVKKHDTNSECEFSDTNPGDWHYSYIASAFNSGMVKGVNETEFGTGLNLTRQDMAVLCYRASGKVEAKRDRIVFEDNAEIAEYAEEAVYELYAAGAINGMGDNKFCPEAVATRAQAAVMIYNLYLK